MKSDLYETGVSGHQKTILSVFRKTYAKVMRELSSIVALKKYGQNSSYEAFQNKISQLDLSFELSFEFARSRTQKMGGQNQIIRLIDTQLETLLFVFYYLKRTCSFCFKCIPIKSFCNEVL